MNKANNSTSNNRKRIEIPLKFCVTPTKQNDLKAPTTAPISNESIPKLLNAAKSHENILEDVQATKKTTSAIKPFLKQKNLTDSLTDSLKPKNSLLETKSYPSVTSIKSNKTENEIRMDKSPIRAAAASSKQNSNEKPKSNSTDELIIKNESNKSHENIVEDLKDTKVSSSSPVKENLKQDNATDSVKSSKPITETTSSVSNKNLENEVKTSTQTTSKTKTGAHKTFKIHTNGNQNVKQKSDLNTKLDRISIKTNSKTLNKHELAVGYGFNDDQIAVFEETFLILDKDANGFITLQEIREVMNSLGYWPSDENIRQRIKAIDSDNSGTVDFQEFICMMSTFRKVKTAAELEQELKDVFKLFDKNCDGFIDKYELKDVLMRLGENITEDEVSDMIREADLDGDNKVSFIEFRSILSENKPTIK